MTREQHATSTPTVLTGTQTGTWYAIQNRGDLDVYVHIGSTTPAPGGSAFLIPPVGGIGHAKAAGGEQIWVWTAGTASRLIYDEAE